MNLLSHFVHLFDFCEYVGEWVFCAPPPPILNDVRTSLPNSDVYHIWTWMCCFYCHLSPAFSQWDSCFVWDDLAALIGQLEMFGRRMGNGWCLAGCVRVTGTWCDWSMPYYCQTSWFMSVTCVYLLLTPPCVIYYVHLWLELHLYNCKMP